MKKEKELKLETFRNEVDEALQEEGYFIQNNGWVKGIENISGNSFKACIDLMDSSVVFYDFSDHTLSNYMCSCQMKAGKVCKHITALLFELEITVKIKE